MTRLNGLVASFSVFILAWVLSPAALACTLFEEPRTFNTQTFLLTYSNASPSEEPAESGPSPDDASSVPTNDPYGVTPLSVEPRQVVFIGNQPNRTFQVVVTDTRRETLAALRICVIDAFATQTQLGRYIQVGSFTHRSEAELVSRQLEQAGYPVRVIHVGNIDASAVMQKRMLTSPREKR